MKIESSAFAPGAEIPRLYTCEGEDISPPLKFSEVPTGAKSLALIVDDPDAPDPAAPRMTWVHWVLYDMPPVTVELAPRATSAGIKARDGQNDWHRAGYGGPCPPIGRHRYFFKLYALDTVFGDLGKPTKPQLEKSMAGHVIARAELIGTYQKQAGR
jgi:Raf kinase inhibitor-like YbhB/YbcL family protein